MSDPKADSKPMTTSRFIVSLVYRIFVLRTPDCKLFFPAVRKIRKKGILLLLLAPGPKTLSCFSCFPQEFTGVRVSSFDVMALVAAGDPIRTALDSVHRLRLHAHQVTEARCVSPMRLRKR